LAVRARYGLVLAELVLNKEGVEGKPSTATVPRRGSGE
jgi:hypothetical protein